MDKIKCAHDEMLEIHKIQPNPKNPNRHPEKQIELLTKIIDYQGQRSPLVISSRSGYLIKGHGRLEAIKKLGWEKAAVDYQDYESEAQEHADMIADNKIAELSEPDEMMIQELVKEMGEIDFDLLGLPDFILNVDGHDLEEKESDQDKPQEFKVEVLCANGEEMTELANELTGRGMIAKAIFRG